MAVMLALLALSMLIFPAVTMDAAAQACRLFAGSVLPGLFPYMVVSSMLLRRMKPPLPALLILLMGWGGGSPAGAKLIHAAGGLTSRQKSRLLIACSALSPMFFLGTLAKWLASPVCGGIALFSVLTSGCLAAAFAGKGLPTLPAKQENHRSLSLQEAVESSARTMLLVCGMTVFFRVCAALLITAFPQGRGVILPVMEVTAAVEYVCQLPLPPGWKTALVSGVAGFGGCSLMMQNRSLCPVMSLPQQILCQVLHGAIAFVLALGASVMLHI